MKKLNVNQMEHIHGGFWGSLACKVGFGVTGGLLGGPIGAAVGATIGNLLCLPLTASNSTKQPEILLPDKTDF
jgi:uncharacterized membrane protein